MWTRSALVLLALITTGMLNACDLCGVFLGISPDDRASNIALYHRYRLLQGDMSSIEHMKHAGHHETSTAYREVYRTLELRADLWLTPRLSVLASLPIVQNRQEVDDELNARTAGIGDPFMLVRGVVLNTPGDRVVHRVLIGGGVKFPLGVNDRQYNDEEVDHDLQPGSGSWDLLGSAEYHMRSGKWGCAFQVIGRANGENSEGFCYGAGTSTSIEFSRLFDKSALKIRPFLGAYHEWMDLDEHDGVSVDGTGCNTVFAQGGARFWLERWSLSLTGQYVVARNDGAMMVPNVFRGLMGLHYLLSNGRAN